jgi:hypothetical protein
LFVFEIDILTNAHLVLPFIGRAIDRPKKSTTSPISSSAAPTATIAPADTVQLPPSTILNLNAPPSIPPLQPRRRLDDPIVLHKNGRVEHAQVRIEARQYDSVLHYFSFYSMPSVHSLHTLIIASIPSVDVNS